MKGTTKQAFPPQHLPLNFQPAPSFHLSKTRHPHVSQTISSFHLHKVQNPEPEQLLGSNFYTTCSCTKTYMKAYLNPAKPTISQSPPSPILIHLHWPPAPSVPSLPIPARRLNAPMLVQHSLSPISFPTKICSNYIKSPTDTPTDI
jgi:hypothetical protein